MSLAILTHYITQYGYLGLSLILGVSILGFPIPDEFLLTFVGFLSYSGQLNPLLAIISAAVGSGTGITIAYFLGRFFGSRITTHLKKHAGSKRLGKVLSWYQHHGGKLLTVGYFIPGVRHLSGYIAGLSSLSYRSFAFFAYLGALLWTTLFIVLGRLLGSRWETLLPVIHHYSILLGVTISILALSFYLLYKNHERWGAWLSTKLKHLPGQYLSLGKRRVFATVGGLSFLVLFIILMGLIQDFVAHEVGEFDELVLVWLNPFSPPSVIYFMQLVNSLGTHLILFLAFLVTTFLFWRSTRRWEHVVPLALAWGGGTVIDLLFRWLFRGENINVFENIYPFQTPSSGFLLAAFCFYAVLGYLIGHKLRWRSQFLLLLAEFILIAGLALSSIFLKIHTPSTMVTALTVSGLWFLVCVFIFEYSVYKTEVRNE